MQYIFLGRARKSKTIEKHVFGTTGTTLKNSAVFFVSFCTLTYWIIAWSPTLSSLLNKNVITDWRTR